MTLKATATLKQYTVNVDRFAGVWLASWRTFSVNAVSPHAAMQLVSGILGGTHEGQLAYGVRS